MRTVNKKGNNIAVTTKTLLVALSVTILGLHSHLSWMLMSANSVEYHPRCHVLYGDKSFD